MLCHDPDCFKAYMDGLRQTVPGFNEDRNRELVKQATYTINQLLHHGPEMDGSGIEPAEMLRVIRSVALDQFWKGTLSQPGRFRQNFRRLQTLKPDDGLDARQRQNLKEYQESTDATQAHYGPEVK